MDATTHWWNPTNAINRLILSPTLAKRASAMMIDLALVSALQFGLSQVFGVYYAITDGTNGMVVNGDGFSFFSTGWASLPYLWLAVIIVAYFTFFEATFGATPGKGLLRLRVVALDGGRPTFRAVVTRNLFRLVDALPALYIVGGAVAQSTRHEQRVGDIVANTTVVAASTVPANRRLPLKLLLVVVVLAALVAGAGAFQYYGRGPLVIQSWANVSATMSLSAPIVCGPLVASSAPGASLGGAYALQSPGRIMQYAIGAPQWGNGVVTYPIRIQVWNGAHDSGYISGEPTQESMSALTAGQDVYDGSVTLRWVGPLSGGWALASGQISC